MSKCFICGHSEDEVLKLFCFPSNPDKCRLWLEKLGFVYQQNVSRHHRICNNHFTNDSFIPFTNVITLRRDAVPKRFVIEHQNHEKPPVDPPELHTPELVGSPAHERLSPQPVDSPTNERLTPQLVESTPLRDLNIDAVIYEAPVVSDIGCWLNKFDINHTEGAFKAGMDKENAVYVARANRFDAWLPGKFVENTGAYVSMGGQEIVVSERYEILCLSKMRWQKAVGGQMPANAFVGGKSSNGEVLYVGRVNNKGRVAVGKISAPYEVCSYPMDKSEVTSNDFDILVV